MAGDVGACHWVDEFWTLRKVVVFGAIRGSHWRALDARDLKLGLCFESGSACARGLFPCLGATVRARNPLVPVVRLSVFMDYTLAMNVGHRCAGVLGSYAPLPGGMNKNKYSFFPFL